MMSAGERCDMKLYQLHQAAGGRGRGVLYTPRMKQQTPRMRKRTQRRRRRRRRRKRLVTSRASGRRRLASIGEPPAPRLTPRRSSGRHGTSVLLPLTATWLTVQMTSNCKTLNCTMHTLDAPTKFRFKP